METLEFIIYPDGRVKEMVTGVVGTSCEEVTQKIESQLGTVVSREATSEFFRQSVHSSSEVDAHSRLSYSDWS